MEPTFVLINQLGQYLNKHKAWISGRDSQLVYRTIHKDEALNLVFEMSSKDTELRARVITVELDDKAQPIIEPGPISEFEIQKDAQKELKLDDSQSETEQADTQENTEQQDSAQTNTIEINEH